MRRGRIKQRIGWTIVDLLRLKAEHDFRLYKPGTLRRRIERRMALADCDGTTYLQMLRDDPKELDLLAKDLLINVTCFFRDPKVFDFLAEKILPGLILDHPTDQPLRIWIAGCSTGEETYSLAMLFREAMEAQGKAIKLQVLASDIDGDAVAQAREGVYPASIDAEVSPDRLVRFSSRRNADTGSPRTCAKMSFSPFRICSPTLRSPGWISCPAAIC